MATVEWCLKGLDFRDLEVCDSPHGLKLHCSIGV